MLNTVQFDACLQTSLRQQQLCTHIGSGIGPAPILIDLATAALPEAFLASRGCHLLNKHQGASRQQRAWCGDTSAKDGRGKVGVLAPAIRPLSCRGDTEEERAGQPKLRKKA